MTRHMALALLVLASIAGGPHAFPGASLAQPAPPRHEPPPGDPAPPQVVAEIGAALTEAIRRFERGDVEGVLARVSDRYRTGPLTKPVLRQQLLAMFATNDGLRARVRIDDVRMIGDRAWIYSTGEVTGRVKFLGTPLSLLAWDNAPEVAWRENGTWRLIGDQQG
jgi:hypothetical protein